MSNLAFKEIIPGQAPKLQKNPVSTTSLPKKEYTTSDTRENDSLCCVLVSTLILAEKNNELVCHATSIRLVWLNSLSIQ